VTTPAPTHPLDGELAKCGAVLVPDRVLRRVIRLHRDLRGTGLQVPHERCYTLPKSQLAPLVDDADLAVPLAELPERVVLVHGDRAHLATADAATRTALWRSVFHGHVHRAFEDKLAGGTLTSAAIRERVHRVGQVEFDEIRSVLRQEHLLLPPVDTTSIYGEFAALYLELRHFAPDALARTFPAALDLERIDAVIALDIDAAELLAASRPASAPERPIVVTRAPSVPAPEAAPEVVVPAARKAALAARERGNHARAALQAARAGDPDMARRDLDSLVAALARVLGGADTAGWTDALLPVAQLSGTRRSRRYSVGARLLHDLQAAVTEATREVKAVDAVGWALSRGKRPLVRALPATREVRIASHIHAALAKVKTCELATQADRDRLAEAVHEISEHADEQVRAACRPKIAAALHAVGLEPRGVVERAAEKTLVDELVGRATAAGRLSLGDLRDALSRNDLKLPDLTIADVQRGDPLLRADQELSHSLDGVYRRGETYLRALQRASSLFFATSIGRLLTVHVLLPLLGAFAVIEGLQHMLAPLAHKMGYEFELSSRSTLVGGALFLWVMIHLRLVRRWVALGFRYVWRGIRLVLFDLPFGLWSHPVVQRFRKTRVVRYAIRPAPPALIAAWVASPLGWWRWLIAAAVFAAGVVVLNTRRVRVFEEIIADWAVRSGRHFLHRMVPELVRVTLDLFARFLDTVERGLYRVDEWLRFRSGQPTIALVAKGVFGTIWFFVAYVVRFYVNLFVEPTVNPIKHFPVVTVAAKIMLPFIPSMLSGISSAATPLLGPSFGGGFAAFTVLVIPGLAGFLVWELKENWKLYRATRAKELPAAAIGHHGETVGRLLRLGFHSGTIPKLFTKLRRSAWKQDEVGMAAAKEGLHHVEEAVERFADRQLALMLNEIDAFGCRDVQVAHVAIGSNTIRIELACASAGPVHATIRIELRAGWLVASLDPGWINTLGETQRRIFEVALAGFYKRAGIDLVREQLDASLRTLGTEGPPRYDLDEQSLIVWPGQGFETEILYALASPRLRRTVRGEPYSGELVELHPRQTVFGKQPLYGSVWATTWQQIERGVEPMRVISGRPVLPSRS
jgi:hypothetical protein